MRKKNAAIRNLGCNIVGPGLASAATVLMLFGAIVGKADAQVLVTDVESNATQNLEFAKQALQYEKQIQQYATQLEQLRNMLTKIESLGSGISLVPKTLEPLSSADQEKLADQACPGAPASAIVAGAISGLLGSSSQPITVRQNLICRMIVMTQVDEYNITAQALGSLTAQASTLQKLSGIVDSISTFGESSSATSQAEQFMSQLKLAGDTWQKQIEADEKMIAALREQQGTLAKVALNGSNTILGNVVQAAALKAAFTINE
ncbi:hypothetical protein [Dyella sp.]|jgi:conjugal transfer/entry exclusion protein|uniref:hypothetical protein n=1 Tax=Dyella sp. TaxID=1869338 RepID=UPI002D77B6B9|nr:hypothetical protein [Dyella sp.]HET6431812.1 hypothetical protein [Dyella sp.]